MKQLPVVCPSCGAGLRIRSMHCPACDTVVAGDYALPALLRLPVAEQQFVLDFVRSSGSLKEMSRKMGLSYPTVRNKLDDIIARLETSENSDNHEKSEYENLEQTD